MAAKVDRCNYSPVLRMIQDPPVEAFLDLPIRPTVMLDRFHSTAQASANGILVRATSASVRLLGLPSGEAQKRRGSTIASVVLKGRAASAPPVRSHPAQPNPLLTLPWAASCRTSSGPGSPERWRSSRPELGSRPSSTTIAPPRPRSFPRR